MYVHQDCLVVLNCVCSPRLSCYFKLCMFIKSVLFCLLLGQIYSIVVDNLSVKIGLAKPVWKLGRWPCHSYIIFVHSYPYYQEYLVKSYLPNSHRLIFFYIWFTEQKWFGDDISTWAVHMSNKYIHLNIHHSVH